MYAIYVDGQCVAGGFEELAKAKRFAQAHAFQTGAACEVRWLSFSGGDRTVFTTGK